MAFIEILKKSESNEPIRNVVETEIVNSHRKNLQKLMPLYKEIEAALGHMDRIQQLTDNICSNIEVQISESGRTIEMSKDLNRAWKFLDEETSFIERFIGTYQLTNDESALLQSSNAQLSKELFDVVEKISTIHDRCASLIHDQRYPAGVQISIEIMEQMANLKENVMELLFKLTSVECRLLVHRRPTVVPGLRKALALLEERCTLHGLVVAEYISARRRTLDRSLVSLYSEGESPLDALRSNMPIYLTILLNWLHDEFIAEHRLAISLFEQQQQQQQQQHHPYCDHILSIIDKIVASSCQLIKDRIEQNLMSLVEPTHGPLDPVNTAKTLLCSVRLLNSFITDLKRALGSDQASVSLTMVTVQDLSQFTQSILINYLQQLIVVKMLVCDPSVVTGDLQPTQTFTRCVQTVRNVCLIGTNIRPPSSPSSFVARLVNDWMIDSLLNSINLTASRLPRVQASIFSVNCLLCIRHNLREFIESIACIERIELQFVVFTDSLGVDQGRYVLEYIGLSEMNDMRNTDPAKDRNELEENCKVLFVKATNIMLREKQIAMKDLQLINSVDLIEKVIQSGIEALRNTLRLLMEWLENNYEITVSGDLAAGLLSQLSP